MNYKANLLYILLTLIVTVDFILRKRRYNRTLRIEEDSFDYELKTKELKNKATTFFPLLILFSLTYINGFDVKEVTFGIVIWMLTVYAYIKYEHSRIKLRINGHKIEYFGYFRNHSQEIDKIQSISFNGLLEMVTIKFTDNLKIRLNYNKYPSESIDGLIHHIISNQDNQLKISKNLISRINNIN